MYVKKNRILIVTISRSDQNTNVDTLVTANRVE